MDSGGTMRDARGVVIAGVYGPLHAIQLANAQFIVRACNSHDDLLAACKAAKLYFEPGPKCPPEHHEWFRKLMKNDPIWKLLTAAIARAQPEKETVTDAEPESR